jgi:hypothetical protein
MLDYIVGSEGLTGYRGALKESNHFSKEMMVELFEIPKDDPIRRYIVVHSDEWNDWPEGVLLKLVSLGYLIRESQLTKFYLFQERLMLLEQDTKRDLFECIKAEMVKYPDYDFEQTEEVVREFVDMYRDQPFRLHVGKKENLYATQSVEKLMEGNPLVVSDHKYPLISKFKKRQRPDTLYEEQGLLLFQWFMGAYTSRKRNVPYDVIPPTDILEDDPIILQRIAEGGSDVYVIATDDKKLIRLLRNRFPSEFIIHMPVAVYLRTNTEVHRQGQDYDEELGKRFRSIYGPLELQVICDKGSIESYMAKYHPMPDSSGRFYQVIGIPWRKDIKASNLERKPLHGILPKPEPESFERAKVPRCLYDNTVHNALLRYFGGASRPQGR